MAGPVHYEVYVRKTAVASWSLTMATEDRKTAIEAAEDLLADRRAAAVRVTKETLDPDTMEFASIAVMTRGESEPSLRKPAPARKAQPGCGNPQDLYTPHARGLIGQVLEDWLARHGVTAFELLHRPDLAERLEASGIELLHAIQKVAIPESQATGLTSHELIRHYQALADRAISRVIAAGRGRTFENLADQSLADLAHRLSFTPDRAFVMGGLICHMMIPASGGRDRLAQLVKLADRAPYAGPGRPLVMTTVEQILGELLTSPAALAEILGPSLDHGARLAALVRIIAPREVEALIASDPGMALQTPALCGPAAQLGARIAAGDFPVLTASLARMVLRELMGPRRLRPADAIGEIDILRTLAMALTSIAGRVLTPEDVQQAFTHRSRSLVAADFVAAYVGSCRTALEEAQHLTRLCENVTGLANKRSAARWLKASVTSPRFETELRVSQDRPTQKLANLAALQRSVRASALSGSDEAEIATAIGAIGGRVEAEARLTAQLARTPAPVPQRLAALLRLAAGNGAPFGPAADRAKAEAIRLIRAPETRAALGEAPDSVAELRDLMKAVGLAA